MQIRLLMVMMLARQSSCNSLFVAVPVCHCLEVGHDFVCPSGEPCRPRGSRASRWWEVNLETDGLRAFGACWKCVRSGLGLLGGLADARQWRGAASAIGGICSRSRSARTRGNGPISC